MGYDMRIQIRGSGTEIECRHLTDEQYRYWNREGAESLKSHLAGDDCPDRYAITDDNDVATIVGPCPYFSMMYVIGDVDGDLQIDLADVLHDYPEKLVHRRKAVSDPVPHYQMTRELEGTFLDVELAGDEFLWDKFMIGMTYFDGSYMIDQVEYDGQKLAIGIPQVISDRISINPSQ